MTPRQIIWAIAVLIWVNVLPYLSRLPSGFDWVSEYLPDEGFVIFGLIFFHALYSTPAIPLIKSLREIGKPDLLWALALVAVTALTWGFHKDHDLSADAQAATGLVIFPLLAMGSAYLILMLGRKLPRLPSEFKKRKQSKERQERKKSSAYREGDLAFRNNRGVDENPYGENDPKFNEWIDGWNDAYESRKQIVNNL